VRRAIVTTATNGNLRDNSARLSVEQSFCLELIMAALAITAETVPVEQDVLRQSEGCLL
jgi:hypothetical protein